MESLASRPVSSEVVAVPQLLDYAGATGRLDIDAVSRLGRRFAVQPKHDGCYVHLHLDDRGRIARVLSRTGSPIPRRHVEHLLGAFVGWPGAVLVGELEAHTERGNRDAKRRGYALVHLFDAVRAERGRYIASEPYAARRDALFRMQSEVVNLNPDRPWASVSGLRGRKRSSGRYCRAVPTDWRLTPITEQLPVSRAAELWDRAVAGESEGLVVVALDAPLGRRRSKRKVKPHDTASAVCVSMDSTGSTLRVLGSKQLVHLGPRQPVPVHVGHVYELTYEGRYGAGSLRFARVERERSDVIPLRQ